ncbi:MAG: FecR domain-containing protein, partial [Verrucomicrobia bacterium]|nr:FecR domain-containing protein [Verrucomicrobiota bacterium]
MVARLWRALGARVRGRWAWASAAVLALGAAAWWTVRPDAPEAYLARVESATWDASQVSPKIGDRLESRRLQLDSGLVELKFAHGATVIVEGPADFEVLGPQHAFLHRGRAVTRLAPGTRGFILDSPRGRLVDQGTEFGVSVGASGDTEVHVLEGKVEAVPSHQQAVQLSVNQAARLTPLRVEQFAADAGGFITDLPPLSGGVVDFLHWSFDEGQGKASYNSGRGLGAPQAKAILRSFPEGAAGPQWIEGQFGGGLSFNGRDDFVECEFPGIPGGEPRTVAFWVKVPRDWTVEEGYGIINWGTHKPGLAWQISVNPQIKEGPTGRLRLGVMDGFVVGTTDLRDDRWHHCAVVMYGGHRPDSATHILLYLDGELEPAARKAVMEIRTQIAGADAHNMWLGRNLAYARPG